MEIKLQNGKEVLAAMINMTYVVDESRSGAGNVICEESHIQGPHRFVVWTVYPNWDENEAGWIAEHGDYLLSWEEAMERMVERFNRRNLGRKCVEDYPSYEPF
jgi:hypothetical protein